MNTCTLCSQAFNSERLFNAHKVGRHAYLYSPEQPDGRRCRTAAEMLNRGWHKNKLGRWVDPARARDVKLRMLTRQPLGDVGVDLRGNGSEHPTKIPPARPSPSERDPDTASVYTEQENEDSES